MSWKYIPFVLFLVFAVFISLVRSIVTPKIPLAEHAVWLIVQYILLLGFWFSIKAIARFLDKRLSYNKRFSTRVFVQIMSSVLVLVPAVLFIYFLAAPWLPDFSDSFISIICILLFMVIVVMNVVFAAGFFFNNWQYTVREKAKAEEERKNAELALAQARHKQTEIEMRALRAQMNPHFIFNSLNSINKYILKNDQANASRYLSRFAKLIRLILDNSNSREVALSDELDALRLYIEMEALRFTNKFDCEIVIDEQVNDASLQVPPLIIQPYVENAIWHGLLHKETGGRLFIGISIVPDGVLRCVIEDNGIGRAKARELKSKSATSNKSLGMQLTQERITMLNQNSSLNADIQIVDMENAAGEAAGTKVILSIPI